MKYILLPLLLLSLEITSAAPDLKPARLTCEYISNPLGIDTKLPRFSWILSSQARNQSQSAYELIVSDDLKRIQAGTGTHWSTRKMVSSQTLHIVYNGNPLQPHKRYYWRVKVYDRDGNASAWSETAWFETAMFDAGDWKAKWIGDGSVKPQQDEDYYKEDRMPLLRRPFSIRKNISAARLYISGLGYYEAYLNGQKVNDHVLDPGFTTYSKQVLYAVHDVTALLKKGNNVAGVMLGNGWWNPLPFKFFGRWDLRQYQQTGRPCVKAELHIQYDDGSSDNIITDETWQTAPGPVTHNNIYLGEQYDARLEIKNWNITATNGTNWKQAVLVDGPKGILTAQMQPAIAITKELKPVSIKEQGKDTFIVDMGQNFAGTVNIKVKGAAGTKVSLRYGEALFDNGSLNYMSSVATQIKKGGIKGGPGAPETAWQEDGYILKGEGMESWSPRFTFHGFRYIEITGWPGKPTVNDIVGLRMQSQLEQNGQFTCSNELFNKLHDVIQWTFLSNVFSVQSDCPAREKMGYGGDMVATANAFMYNYNMAQFYRKAVRDFANEQRPEGGITEIAPWTGIADKGFGDGSGPLGWQLAFPFLQKQLYDQYGDLQIIRDNYEAFKKQLAFLKSKAVDGMFYWDISDHEALDAKPEALTATCFYYHHLQLAATFAGLLHKTDDSVQFAKQAQSLKGAIARKFLVKGTGRFDNGTQSAQLFALWYDLSPEKDLSIQALLDEFKRHDDHISTGIFSTKMLFDVLREHNMQDLVYRIVNQRSFPGWGFMLEKDATTLWESWHYPGTVYSFNHPMFGSVDEWFYRSLLGINAAAPGYEKILLKVQAPDSLTSAKGSYESVRGPISSSWEKKDGAFSWMVSIPANTTAEVWIPCKTNAPIMERGLTVTNARYEPGYAVIQIGSGQYEYHTKR